MAMSKADAVLCTLSIVQHHSETASKTQNQETLQKAIQCAQL